MKEVRREMPSDDPGFAYRQLITEFLDIRAVRGEHEGYPAIEGELIADGAGVLAERKLLVFVRAVLCEWPEGSGVKAAPSLWFLICKDGHAPEAFVGSFAVETDLVLEALQNIDPAGGDLQIPLPAVEAREPGIDSVVAGGPLHLHISSTRIESAAGEPKRKPPAAGIRFAVKRVEKERKRPSGYSFAMAGLTPFLALDAAMVQYSGLSSFALELEELRQEIEGTPGQ
jgi:hypothetical protein